MGHEYNISFDKRLLMKGKSYRVTSAVFNMFKSTVNDIFNRFKSEDRKEFATHKVQRKLFMRYMCKLIRKIKQDPTFSAFLEESGK